MEAILVGAGVVGLSTAIRLLERGHRVRILARERTPRTTSDVAAAVYFPFHAEPARRVLPWARASLRAFRALARDPETGVVMRDILQAVGKPADAPWWAEMAPYRRAAPHELPPGVPAAFVLHGPVVEMPIYMRWLESRVADLGGHLETRELTHLDELAAEDADVVVHCAGLGARTLADDPRVHPLRGQVALVRGAEVPRALMDLRDTQWPAYVIPRRDGIILGGTCGPGADTMPDAAQEAGILRRARALEPALAGAEVVARAVGLRPARDEVRLAPELRGMLRVVHNYGHGGAGVTLSWGCADEAASLAEAAAASRLRLTMQTAP